MISKARATEIRSLAREKMAEHNGLTLPVRPKFVAQKLDIVVMPFDPPEPEVSGFLMQSGNEFGNGYAEAIKNEGFQNFTLAHELGHYFIPGHPEALLKDEGMHYSKAGYIAKHPCEREADIFATEFLMPWKLIDPLVNRGQRGFEAVNLLADSCGSSLLASAIRYTEVTRECVVVVVSCRGIVEFMTASEPFRSGGIGWLERGDLLSHKVPSSRLALDETWINSSQVVQEGTYLDHWFASAPHVEIEEDVVGLGSYGRMLSVLFMDWSPEEQLEDDSEEDDYIERWKDGRFRKK